MMIHPEVLKAVAIQIAQQRLDAEGRRGWSLYAQPRSAIEIKDTSESQHGHELLVTMLAQAIDEENYVFDPMDTSAPPPKKIMRIDVYFGSNSGFSVVFFPESNANRG